VPEYCVYLTNFRTTLDYTETKILELANIPLIQVIALVFMLLVVYSQSVLVFLTFKMDCKMHC
jgi:hypothetical protein